MMGCVGKASRRTPERRADADGGKCDTLFLAKRTQFGLSDLGTTTIRSAKPAPWPGRSKLGKRGMPGNVPQGGVTNSLTRPLKACSIGCSPAQPPALSRPRSRRLPAELAVLLLVLKVNNRHQDPAQRLGILADRRAMYPSKPRSPRLAAPECRRAMSASSGGDVAHPYLQLDSTISYTMMQS
jgi:hypothetical protein